jgi:hypothetical protein
LVVRDAFPGGLVQVGQYVAGTNPVQMAPNIDHHQRQLIGTNPQARRGAECVCPGGTQFTNNRWMSTLMQ